MARARAICNAARARSFACSEGRREETAGLGFPALTTVGGRLCVDNSTLPLEFELVPADDETARLAAARHIHDNPTLDLPVLSMLGGDVQGIDHHAPMSLNLPALSTVGGDVILESTLSLASLSLPALRAVGGHLTLEDASPLAELSLPELATVGGLCLKGAGSLSSLALPKLATVDRGVFIGGSALESLCFPVLATLGEYLLVVDNPKLPECQQILLRDRLGAILAGGSAISGNDTPATCR